MRRVRERRFRLPHLRSGWAELVRVPFGPVSLRCVCSSPWGWAPPGLLCCWAGFKVADIWLNSIFRLLVE